MILRLRLFASHRLLRFGLLFVRASVWACPDHQKRWLIAKLRNAPVGMNAGQEGWKR